MVQTWPLSSDKFKYNFCAKCSHCSKGICGIFAHKLGNVSYTLNNAIGSIDDYSVYLNDAWPRPKKIDVPLHVPELVSSYYIQALSSVSIRSFDAAAMMFRKCLEVATKSIDPSTEKMKLVDRIDRLFSSRKITEEMKDWAHEIRLGGNEAAHEDAQYSETECQALTEFTEAFLTYSFTLPYKIAKRRQPSGE